MCATVARLPVARFERRDSSDGIETTGFERAIPSVRLRRAAAVTEAGIGAYETLRRPPQAAAGIGAGMEAQPHGSRGLEPQSTRVDGSPHVEAVGVERDLLLGVRIVTDALEVGR